MIRLSININKVATLRNSRGGTLPSVTQAARVCIDAGAHGITVHPRADERHITRYDVPAVASLLAPFRSKVEFNIEGDPRPDLLQMVRDVRPHSMVKPEGVVKRSCMGANLKRSEGGRRTIGSGA